MVRPVWRRGDDGGILALLWHFKIINQDENLSRTMSDKDKTLLPYCIVFTLRWVHGYTKNKVVIQVGTARY